MVSTNDSQAAGRRSGVQVPVPPHESLEPITSFNTPPLGRNGVSRVTIPLKGAMSGMVQTAVVSGASIREHPKQTSLPFPDQRSPAEHLDEVVSTVQGQLHVVGKGQPRVLGDDLPALDPSCGSPGNHGHKREDSSKRNTVKQTHLLSFETCKRTLKKGSLILPPIYFLDVVKLQLLKMQKNQFCPCCIKASPKLEQKIEQL